MVAVAVELGDQLVNAAAGIDFGEQQPCAAVGGRRFGRGRLKNRNRVRAFRAHITSELKVLCGATACFECAGCF